MGVGWRRRRVAVDRPGAEQAGIPEHRLDCGGIGRRLRVLRCGWAYGDEKKSGKSSKTHDDYNFRDSTHRRDHNSPARRGNRNRGGAGNHLCIVADARALIGVNRT
jgi:hypothetical protein